MRSRFLSIILTAVMLIAVVSTSCNAPMKYGDTIPFDNPETILKNYFSLMAANDYGKAYDMLSIETRKGFTKDQFLELQDLYTQSNYIFTNAVSTIQEGNLPAVDSVRYASASLFSSKLDYADGNAGVTSTQQMNYYIVAEDGSWKVHLPNSKITYQNFIVYALTRLGLMYSAGTKVAVDKAKALEYFQKVLTYVPKNSIIHTYAALTCLDLEQYDQAMTYINKAAGETKKNEELINIYCVKAAIYAKTNKTADANKWFDKAQVLEDALPPDSTKPDIVANFRAKYLPQ